MSEQLHQLGMPPQQPVQQAGQAQPGQLGQPFPQGPPPWAWVRPTNTKAILALCLLWVPVAPIVLGLQARREIARTGEGGQGMATWGLALGIAVVSLYVLYFVFLIVYVLGVFAIVGGGLWQSGAVGA